MATLCLRYNSNGSLDTTFDDDGKLVSNLGTSAFDVHLAIQTNGRLVVAGMTDSANYNFILARYNPNGSLDATFDGDGKVITDFGNSDLARAIILQPDSRILVAGSTGNVGDGYTYDLALARLQLERFAGWDLRR